MPHSGILDGIGVFSWLTGGWKKWIYKLDPNRWLHMFGTRLVCLSPLAVNIFELFIFSAMHQTQYRHQPPSFSIHIIYNILYFQPSSYIYILYFWLAARVCGQPAAWWSMQKRFVTKAVTDSDRWPEIWSWPSKLRHTWPCPPKRKQGHDAVQESTHYTGDERWPDIKLICFFFATENHDFSAGLIISGYQVILH